MISTCREFSLESQGDSHVYDVTEQVRRIVEQEGLQEGLATVFTPGATASVTTIEFESGAVADLRRAVERLAPRREHYRHDARWGDGNGFSHVRAALLGPSLAVPVSAGQLVLGTWQQIVVIDHDNRARNRRVAVQLLGSGP
ncbi:MAG: YjbQ family protein [Deltaproteobacteria bacterium]|nr:MAG: YjbQ family protein [Deltaproteobacteria bacterium]